MAGFRVGFYLLGSEGLAGSFGAGLWLEGRYAQEALSAAGKGRLAVREPAAAWLSGEDHCPS